MSHHCHSLSFNENGLKNGSKKKNLDIATNSDFYWVEMSEEKPFLLPDGGAITESHFGHVDIKYTNLA